MTARRDQSKRASSKKANEHRHNVASKLEPTSGSGCIDSRNESAKRYAGLEPEGHTSARITVKS